MAEATTTTASAETEAAKELLKGIPDISVTRNDVTIVLKAQLETKGMGKDTVFFAPTEWPSISDLAKWSDEEWAKKRLQIPVKRELKELAKQAGLGEEGKKFNGEQFQALINGHKFQTVTMKVLRDEIQAMMDEYLDYGANAPQDTNEQLLAFAAESKKRMDAIRVKRDQLEAKKRTPDEEDEDEAVPAVG